MIEIEAKIKIEKQDFDRILDLIGPVKFEMQKNYIYNLNEGFLRIRFEKGKTYLTYKGKRQDKKYNVREEREIHFEGNRFNEFKNYFSFFGQGFSYEKQRASFGLNDCVVCIDKLPNGDNYLEVEGNSENILKCLNKFGLNDKEIEKRNYQEILFLKNEN